MADLGTLITIADNVFKILQSPILREMKDWESDLEKLNKSVSFIKNLLLDADKKPELSHVEQGWIDELTEVLYEADDLFDEVVTIAKLKELNSAGAKLSKKILNKVSRLFSSKNHILLSYNTSQEVKSIQQKLAAIAQNRARYEFKVDSQVTLGRKEETCSFLDENHENIIGREEDVKDVLDMLFDPQVEENVGFVVVVGIGGLGKTTLARLVYNHDRVNSNFHTKFWACVSDQDGKGLNVKAILGDIIESSTNLKTSAGCTMESIQTTLEPQLKNKTFLLVLDDVWTEDPNEWNKLKRFLTIGGKGSRVVVTTRSEKTAEVVLGKTSHSKKYMLKGLSPENSWRLFVLTAFEREPDQSTDSQLIETGKLIVNKCCCVPLAIKVLGTLLYGQTERWESFERIRLPQIEAAKNPIMSILKLSYNNLEPSLKNCFRYCALFPKNFKMDKQRLISLWMAQGYIGDDTEDHFLILLKRCFFQNVERDDLGDIESIKMHDLMHDLALEVAGDEIIAANSLPNILCRKNRHLFLDGTEWTETSLPESNIRTCYMNSWVHSSVVKPLVASWRSLRSLRLFVVLAEYLPEAIGQLLHLRYLDLSGNMELKTLPNSIGNLYNLQSLILYSCRRFKEWPRDFCKLVNLRLLDIRCCLELTCMPLGIGQLTNLDYLTDFKVGGVSSIGKQMGGHLNDLKFLVNLRGQLRIRIYGNLASEKENKWDGGYLEHIKNLKSISISFCKEACESNNGALIEKLQPSRNIMELTLEGYNGIEIPRWGRAHDDWAVIFPNLVTIELQGCERLNGIPLLSKLMHLNELSLVSLYNLEYVETGAISHYISGSEDIQFFPSLKYLYIWCLERLKGWWGGVGESDNSSSSSKSHWLPPFPRLLKLSIDSCPMLTSFPPCPSLESLQVRQSNNVLGISPGGGHGNLDIRSCSSLQFLEIKGCTRLTSVVGALEHLTALESLSLGNTDAEMDFGYMPWGFLSQKLRSLELRDFRTLRILPTEMRHLTALEKLAIGYCDVMEGLPEWISCLSSLHSLTIECCPNFKSLGTIQNITSLQILNIKNCAELRKECEEPSGKECPKIRHIPHIWTKW